MTAPEELPGNHESLFVFAPFELRQVPLGWEHPRDANNQYTPLFNSSVEAYTPQEIMDMIKDGDLGSPEEMANRYMPDTTDTPEDEVGICIYETITDGTPMSPVYANSPEGVYELVQYAAKKIPTDGINHTDIFTWASMLLRDRGQVIVDAASGETTVISAAEEQSD